MTIERYGQPSRVWKPEATMNELSKIPSNELVDVLSLLLVTRYHAVQGIAIRVRSFSRARGFQYIQRKDIRSSLQCDVPYFLCEDQFSIGTIENGLEVIARTCLKGGQGDDVVGVRKTIGLLSPS